MSVMRKMPDTPLDLLDACEDLVNSWDTYELGNYYPSADIKRYEGVDVSLIPAQWVVHCLRDYNSDLVAIHRINGQAYCGECHQRLEDGYRYCPNCGVKLVEISSAKEGL